MTEKLNGPKFNTASLLETIEALSRSEDGRFRAETDAKFFAGDSTHFLRFGIDLALEGDQSFGLTALNFIMWALINGRQLAPEERAFLALFISRISKSPAALNVGLEVKGAGASRRGMKGFNVSVAIRKSLSEGSTVEAAYIDAADKFSISTERAKQLWESWKPRLRDVAIKDFLRSYPDVSREDVERCYDNLWFPRNNRKVESR